MKYLKTFESKLSSTTEEFVQKARQIHGDRYNYSLVDYKNARTPVKIICAEHGVFEQTPDNHLHKKGCPQCNPYSRTNNTETFIKQANKVHGDKYDYSLVNYTGANTPVKIICPRHGIFEQSPYHHKNGVGCPVCGNAVRSTTEDFIRRAKEIHGDKYDYSLVDYKNNRTPVKIICPKHGVFEQAPMNHINRHYNCPSCSPNKKSNTKEFIDKAKLKHGDKYDYSEVIYKDWKTNVTIICSKHGSFLQSPNNHLHGQGCPVCSESQGEKVITKFLTEHEIKFEPQKTFCDCKDKRCLAFDFYVMDRNLCIEFDGGQHFFPVAYWGGEEGLEAIQHRDQLKNEYCQQKNITLLRIKYTDNIVDLLNKAFNGNQF